MKNSGVRWLGDIPKDWGMSKFKAVGKILSGYPFDSEKFSSDSGFPLIRIRDITSGVAGTYYDGKYPKQYIMHDGDFLLGMDGDFNVRWWQGGDALLNQRCCRLTLDDSINSKYIFYLIPFGLKLVNDLAYSTTVKHLSVPDILNLNLLVPPLPEQAAIANFLDAKCAEIDGLLEDLGAEVKTLTEYKKCIIAETVTHGLNLNTTLVPSNLGWIDAIPKHWAIARIASVYSVRNEKVSDKDFPPLSVTMKGIVPQLESAAKTKHGDDRKLIRKGDFVINSRSDRRGSCGISDYDGSCSLINTVLSPREEMNPRYYNWLFHTPLFADEFYKWGYGIVNDLWTTNWGAMRRIQIPMPPLDEQAEIAAYLDEKIPHIEQSIADKLQQIEKLKEYKASLIYEYVTGKKQVP